jgi:hypothetical protein
LPRFVGRSDIASSTATSNSSPLSRELSRMSFRSTIAT